jgi:hypothetical protein
MHSPLANSNLTINSSHRLADKLVSWHMAVPPVDGGSMLYDLAGLDHGTLTGFSSTRGWTNNTRPGGFGPAVTHLASAYVQLPYNLNGFTDFTITSWVRGTSLGSSRGIFGRWDTSPAQQIIIRSNTGALQVFVNNTSNTNFGGNVTLSQSANVWYHVALTCSFGGKLYGYQNGIQGSTSYNPTGTLQTLSAGTNLRIGGLSGSLNSFVGQIDDTMVFGRALSANEIAQLYHESLTGYQSLLLRPKIVIASSSANTYNHTGSGGIKGGSAATVQENCNPSVSGGCKGGSTATVAEVINSISTSGGAVCGSSATCSSIWSNTGSAGAKCGGAADVQGSGQFNETMSGGIVCGSAATAAEVINSITITAAGVKSGSSGQAQCILSTSPTGGATCGSSANVSLVASVTSAAGALAGGNAIDSKQSGADEVGSGGLVIGGSVRPTGSQSVIAASSGIKCAGFHDFGYTANVSTSAGVKLGASSAPDVKYSTPILPAGARLSGSAQPTISESVGTPTSGAKLGSTAPFSWKFNPILAPSGITANGSSQPTQTGSKTVVPAGVKLSGVALIDLISAPAGAAGVQAGGSATLNVVYAVSGASGAVCSSSGAIQKTSTESGTGGAVAGSTGSVSFIGSISGLGGAKLGSNALVQTLISMIGGGKAGGTAVATSRWFLTGAGGAKLGGQTSGATPQVSGKIRYSFRRVDEATYMLSWVSAKTPPVTFRIYREGLQIHSYVSSTSSGEVLLPIGPGETPFIEVLDDNCAIPTLAFPGSMLLNWLETENASTYSIQEYIDGDWEEQRSFTAGLGAYNFQTRWLEDCTDNDFRVVPQDAAGNDGTPLTFHVYQVRHPDPPEVEYSFNPNGTFTVS